MAAATEVHALLAAFPRGRGQVQKHHRYSIVPTSADGATHRAYAGCRPLLRAASWEPLLDHVLPHLVWQAADASNGLAVPASVVASGGTLGLVAAGADVTELTLACTDPGLVLDSLDVLCLPSPGRVGALPVPPRGQHRRRQPEVSTASQLRLGQVVAVVAGPSTSLLPAHAPAAILNAAPPTAAGLPASDWLAGARTWLLSAADPVSAARLVVEQLA